MSVDDLSRRRKQKAAWMRQWKARLTTEELEAFKSHRREVEVPQQRERRRNDGGKHAVWTLAAYWKNPSKHRARQKLYRGLLKAEVMATYGGSCKCCGEDELVFLSIDHINGDGANHRRKELKESGMSFYVWLRKMGYPEGFQVLCMNCNTAKRTGGECPHRTIVMNRILSLVHKKGGGA